MQREAEMFDDLLHHPVGQGSPGMPDGAQQLLGCFFDMFQVIVLRPHLPAKGSVRPPGLSRSGGGFQGAATEFAVQTHERLEGFDREFAARPHRGQLQRLIELGALDRLQLDLQGIALARCCGLEQIRHVDLECGGELLKQGEARLPVPVLDERELRGRDRRLCCEVLKGEARARACVADAAAEGEDGGRGVPRRGSAHSFTIAKEAQIFLVGPSRRDARSWQRLKNIERCARFPQAAP